LLCSQQQLYGQRTRRTQTKPLTFLAALAWPFWLSVRAGGSVGD